MVDFASYEGSSGFLRWWPKILLVAAAWVLFEGWMSAIQWATFFVFAAWAQGHFIPWRFRVLDDGLALLFPFGRRVFLPKSTTTVRLETVGAVAVIEGTVVSVTCTTVCSTCRTNDCSCAVRSTSSATASFETVELTLTRAGVRQAWAPRRS